MIRVTIRKAATARGIKTPAELARLMGVKDAMAGRLWDGGHNATLKTLNKVCGALGCELADVIRYIPNGTKGKPSPARPKKAKRKR